MKRPFLLIALCLAAAVAGCAQTPEKSSEKPAAAEPANMEIWQWANFIILMAGLGYLASKHAPPFFKARTAKIQQAMVEAAHQRKDAEARAAEVDRRLANLDAQIALLREESKKESEAQMERAERQAAIDIARIEAHATQEIEAAGKSARLELKRYAGELALSLAEQKIRARMNPGAQDALVQKFVRDLDRQASQAQTN